MRTLDPSLSVPFCENETIHQFYFTDVFPEADNRTKYYQRQMLEQHKELSVELLPEILFQTYIYRLANKKVVKAATQPSSISSKECTSREPWIPI